MQQVSRKLLVAGVLAFGTLTAACGDKLTVTQVAPFVGVQSVSVSPQNASINVGTSITLAASVVADATTAKTVSWTTSNAAVATVDATGKVTGVTGGTVTIIATATADISKSAGAAIVVTAVAPPVVVNPSININAVIQGVGSPGAGFPVNLSNTFGQIDVTVNTSGGGLIELFLSSSCTTNTIASTDVAVATQQATSAQAGQVTLSFNTAQLTASNVPRFPNGNYCIKARLTNGTAVVVATNTTPITLNNTNVFRGTVAFTSVTGGPVNAVSTTNGLAYNQGTMTVTLNPIVFTSTAAVDKISGYFSKNGEVSGVACGAPPCTIAFTNQQVTSGAVTFAFTDTGSAAGVRSIWGYNSLPAGDTLYITAAIDALGNPITVTPTPGSPAFVIVPATGPNGGIRIDNDVPTLAGAYTVTAANGYIGAAYLFSSGTTGAAATDTKAGVPGVSGLTTTYYVGAVGSAAFATVNSCNITGLVAAAVGTDLANTNNTDANRAKVVVKDALGNQSCIDVASTFGPLFFFGVDKVAPTVSMTTANNGASDVTGYNVSKNFSFIYNDSISGFTAATPIRGTLVRNFFGTPSAADCVIGTFSATALTCSTTNITVTSNFGTPPAAGGSIEFTSGTAVVGYYTITAVARDRALNSSTPALVRIAAFDNVAPTVGAVTQSPAAVVSLGTVTVSASAADNFDLATSAGRLVYNPAGTAPTPVTFQSVAGTSFGPNFDATLVTSGTASVALPNVYRGLQGVDATNVIQANRAGPTATITVTDVGTNTATSAAGAIATTTAGANIQAGNTFTVTPTSAAPATTQTTTSLTARVAGLITDPAFQSQPFAQIDFYKLTGGEQVLVGSVTGVLVTDNNTSGVRTYTYSATSVALTAAAVNTFYAVGRNAAGDAVISNAITVTNP